MAKKPARPWAKASGIAEPLVVTIDGAGTIPLYADGAMRRVDRGAAVEVSEAEKAFLDYSGVKYR